ncbi:MAG: DUF5667 domain-containing protein [Chloroflexota bacterium]|nr:DUF5667 domain-containing protein [Chloroflexota bacterium]
MARDLETQLDECLGRVLSGESLEQCLARYPQEAAQLKPLLETALTVARVTAVKARPEFKARLRYRLEAAASAPGRTEKRFSLFWLPRWAVAMGLLLAASLALGGTLIAAATSLPGEPLYPVKTATEEVQLVLTLQEAPRARLKARLAEARLEEMVALTRRDIEEEDAVLPQAASLESDEEAEPPSAAAAPKSLDQRAPSLKPEAKKAKELPQPRAVKEITPAKQKQAERLIRNLEGLEQQLAHHLTTLESLAAGLQGQEKSLQAKRLKSQLEQRLGPRLAELEEAVAKTPLPAREQAQKILEASKAHYQKALRTLEELEKTQSQLPKKKEPPAPTKKSRQTP